MQGHAYRLTLAIAALVSGFSGCRMCQTPYDYCGPVLTPDGRPVICDFGARVNSVYSSPAGFALPECGPKPAQPRPKPADKTPSETTPFEPEPSDALPPEEMGPVTANPPSADSAGYEYEGLREAMAADESSDAAPAVRTADGDEAEIR